MSVGKIAAQCSHGSMLIALRDQYEAKFQLWQNTVMRKIILSGKLNDIEKIQQQVHNSILIIDKGFTEIEPNSKTVLVLPVMTREESKKLVGRLRLLTKI
jgi:peptidyl-tRNA hydrolase